MKSSCLKPHATAIGCAFAGVILAGILLTSVPVRADIDVRINISNAPPAPRMAFRARPHERLVPGEGIYVVDDPGVGDNDCFRYGGYYWVFRDGYWYRSANWRGRFIVVQPRYVPTVFYRLPPTHWKHHPSGPPGHMNNGGGSPGHMNNGGGGPPGHMTNGGGGPPGLVKKGDGGPPGHTKKGAKNDDQHGDHGRK